MSGFAPVMLVPHYRHVAQFREFLPALQSAGIPILVIDDGSTAAEVNELQELAEAHSFELITYPENRGKGAAVMSGFRHALNAGYSHAVQIDADGQHNAADVPTLIARARECTGALICGEPEFGPEMPAARRYGRKVTDFFVFLETWTFTLKDSMCGLRVYPLSQMVCLVDRHKPGDGMDFDIEVLVRAYWQGLPIEYVKTRVRYPETGRSHYRYLLDNTKITAMHTRLLLGMIPRIPALVMRHFRRPKGQSS